jgi:hypothetical protein
MLLSLAADHIFLVNDMYSYRREALGLERERQKKKLKLDDISSANGSNVQDHEQESCFLNAVCILLREDGVDEMNAMDKLGDHIRRRERFYGHCRETQSAIPGLCRRPGGYSKMGYISDGVYGGKLSLAYHGPPIQHDFRYKG